MKKKFKILIFLSIAVVSSVTAVYAVSLISASDVIYDNKKSGSPSDNVQGAIDDLYGIKGESNSSGNNKRGTNLIDYITNLAKTDTTNLMYDETTDKNLRYIGSNPNNYVLFNNELWRIIGIMNNVRDANGTSAPRIKLIRAESIGNLVWDTSRVNDWSTSSLQKILNSGDYYNRTNAYSSIGLTSDAKTMISNTLWNLGGYPEYEITAQTHYNAERGTTVYSGHTTTWIGYIGLMYSSDYGYGVGGSVRNVCLESGMNNYNLNNCYKNDWLYFDSNNQWTISPRSKWPWDTDHIKSDGSMYTDDTLHSYAVRPVVYLNTNVRRESGAGTSSDPYTLTSVPIYVDDSNASPPKLDDEGKLIPVTLANDGTVTYVSEDDGDWYNYGEKQWANAVILIDSPSKTYKEGDIISENDIESYFVWIPKYKYRLWNTGTASKKVHEIDIAFDTTDTKDVEGESCKTPMTSGSTGNCNNGEYMTHPAFISLGVNGFWVGKFETGYKDANSTASAQVKSNDSSKIIIKPNVYSWRNNTVYNFFLSAYNYERNLDSHMMKNTEWGAVAILSHCKYGINNEININNNSSYKTGYSALPTTNQETYPGTTGDGASYNQAYNTETGYLASTTGNITGVYDMSGGAYEYMASYVSGQMGQSGFYQDTIDNYSKYFDVYNASSAEATYQYRILGDATGEMGPIQSYKDSDGTTRYHNSWYANFSYFVESAVPWCFRGGSHFEGFLASQFTFHRHMGANNINIGSRLVLTG